MDSNLYSPDTEEESFQEFVCFLYTDDNARNCTESTVSSVGDLSVIARHQYQKSFGVFDFKTVGEVLSITCMPDHAQHCAKKLHDLPDS